MRKIATLVAAVMLGSGMAVLGGSAAQAAPSPRPSAGTFVWPSRTVCYTTMPVVPRRLGLHRPAQPTCGWYTPQARRMLHISR